MRKFTKHIPKLFLFGGLALVAWIAFRPGGALRYLISSDAGATQLSSDPNNPLPGVPFIATYTGNANRQ